MPQDLETGNFPERVHIAPVGFEIDRVVLPFLRMKGERIHLIVRRDSNERGINCVESIKKDLEEARKPYEVHQIELDLFKIIYECRKIIEEELKAANHIFVNISSGGSIQGVACHFATLTFKKDVVAYYAYPARYIEFVDSKRPQNSAGLDRIEIVPHYSIDLPSNEEIRFLVLLAKSSPLKKSEVLKECLENGLISTRGRSKPYGHVVLENRFIRPLESKELLVVEGRGRSSRVRLTEKGRNTLLLNGHTVA
ncbi:MAG: DUF6293 family protein [Candidatus Verstraetearchaeota archaeon]|nr:DUF6293 family protein [Candidatus Verstraetearchaeota archaeon]